MSEKYNFLVNGVDVTLIKSNKFKTNSVIISLINNFDKKVATLKSLLCAVLSNTTKKYNTKSELTNKIYDLYDLGIYVTGSVYYKTIYYNFIMEMVDGKIIKDKSLTKEAFSLLKEFIFNPNVENDQFDELVFSEEKRSIRDQINSIYNRKKAYAVNKMISTLGKDEFIGFSKHGNVEDLDKVTSKDLYEYYKYVLENSMVKILVYGNMTPEEVKENLKNFNFKNNQITIEDCPKEVPMPQIVQEVFEYQDIEQAKLVMGFRMNVEIMDDLYPAAIVFNTMFGGMFSSTLFTTIREKNSLAYDISSDMLFDKKLFIVVAGVDSQKVNIVSDLVIKEFEKYKQGQLDQELLEIAKENIVNDYYEMSDSQIGEMFFELRNITKYNNRTLTGIIEKVKNVTSSDIQKLCQIIKLDTIYALKAGDVNE